MTRTKTRAKALAPSQLAVLRLVINGVEANGWAPTVAELCEALGWRSTNAAQEHLTRLQAEGLLARGEKGQARALKPTPAGYKAAQGYEGLPTLWPLRSGRRRLAPMPKLEGMAPTGGAA